MIRQIPLGDTMIITANKTERTNGGIVLLDNAQILQEQEVLAISKTITEIEVGDKVYINWSKFTKKVSKNSKVAKDPSQPDNLDTIIGYDDLVEIPVYMMDGIEVIAINKYDIMPWKLPKEEAIDKSKIVTNLNKFN